MSLWKMTDEEASKPKYLSDTLRNEQTVSDLDATVGVDASEESVTANKAKGMQHPGWVTVRSYTDQHGNTRYKTETLVAAGSMGTDTGGGDDEVAEDPNVMISMEAGNVYIVSPGDVTLTPTITPNGVFPMTYQWYDGNDAALAGETGPTLTLTGITAPQSYYIKVTVPNRVVQGEVVNILED